MFVTTSHFIDPLTFPEIKKDFQIDSKTYLVFASKRKEITRKKILNFKFSGKTHGIIKNHLQTSAG